MNTENTNAEGQNKGEAPSWASRLRTYLQLGRVSNLPTVWSNALAGMILAGGAPSVDLIVPLWGGLTLFYTGGMFLNDAFDAGFDREHNPERPIPSGRVSELEVYMAGFAQIIVGLALVTLPTRSLGGPPQLWPLVGGTVLAALIVYYDWRHKRDPLAPLVMGGCRAATYFIAAALAGAPFAPPVWWGIAVMLGYLIGLTYAAKQENLNTIGRMWPLLFLAAPFLFAAPTLLAVPVSAPFYILFAVWAVYALSFLIVPSRRKVPRAVVSLIAGISLLDALLIAGTGVGNIPWAIAAIGSFALTLVLQRWISGT